MYFPNCKLSTCKRAFCTFKLQLYILLLILYIESLFPTFISPNARLQVESLHFFSPSDEECLAGIGYDEPAS